jgi:hypothetical protein
LCYKRCQPFGSAEPNSSWQGDAWSGGGDAHPPCGPLRHGRIATSKLYLKPLNRPRTRTRFSETGAGLSASVNKDGRNHSGISGCPDRHIEDEDEFEFD